MELGFWLLSPRGQVKSPGQLEHWDWTSTQEPGPAMVALMHFTSYIHVIQQNHIQSAASLLRRNSAAFERHGERSCAVIFYL